MPKDPPRNQPNYKIGGRHINEYEYEHRKGQVTEETEQMPRNKDVKNPTPDKGRGDATRGMPGSKD